jgi:hypothetical protein
MADGAATTWLRSGDEHVGDASTEDERLAKQLPAADMRASGGLAAHGPV